MGWNEVVEKEVNASWHQKCWVEMRQIHLEGISKIADHSIRLPG
jgi:hypothetical protein